MVKLGPEPRGAFGAGVTTSAPYEGKHWNPAQHRVGRKSNYVDLNYSSLSKVPLVTWKELHRGPFSKTSLGIQASGVMLAPPVVEALETLWRQRVKEVGRSLPSELSSRQSFPEGAKKTITLNSYERSAKARAAGLDSFGYGWSVCGLKMEKRYGSIAARSIHIHHIRPLSKVSRRYRVDPMKDLRPICPNCHAVIHLREPPLTIAEAKKLLRR